MFAPMQPQTDWRKYQYPPVRRIYVEQDSGDENLGIVWVITGVLSIASSIWSWYSSKKKKKKMKKAIAAFNAQMAAEQARLRREEERLRKEQEEAEFKLRELTTRVASAEPEYLKYTYPKPLIEPWGTMTGKALVTGTGIPGIIK